MKTTLVLPEPIAAELKREAARLRTTMSQVATTALRVFFQSQKGRRRKLKPLPTFDGGGPPLVDVADRDALYSKMGGRW